MTSPGAALVDYRKVDKTCPICGEVFKGYPTKLPTGCPKHRNKVYDSRNKRQSAPRRDVVYVYNGRPISVVAMAEIADVSVPTAYLRIRKLGIKPGEDLSGIIQIKSTRGRKPKGTTC